MNTDQVGRIGAAQACITDPRHPRPTGVATLLRDANIARSSVGWRPKTTLPELVVEKVAADCAAAKRDRVIKLAGLKAYDCNE